MTATMQALQMVAWQQPPELRRVQRHALHAQAFALAPVVERIRNRLAGLAPCGARMSGSGSAVFAVCRDRAEAAQRQEWPADAPPPPTPELPEPPPITFGIARPARLLGIAWAVSVPAVLWSHIKFSNPVAVVIVGEV